MTSYELISLFVFIAIFIAIIAGWIFTYRIQIETQQAIAKLTEKIESRINNLHEVNTSENLHSDILLSAEEMKDLALWYSSAKRWFLKGKGTAVDWENKHLREEIASPIRQKLADAKNELDIKDAFDLRNIKSY